MAATLLACSTKIDRPSAGESAEGALPSISRSKLRWDFWLFLISYQ